MTEVLSPAGSLESLTAALRCGCDAVYLGGETFSARANATNFTNEELKQAVSECHKRGVKVYQAINTVVLDSQLEECKNAVRFAAEIGIDGLITQDLCLVAIVKQCCPQLEIHASTQMTIHSENGVEMTKRLGFSRAVVSREMPQEVMKRLCALGTEIEAFVHGALCMSVSGQCYMSAVIGSRSANRGLCAQACRLPVSAVKGAQRYDLSLKDMSYLSQIDSLKNAGVTSYKIEGRMKRPEYVAKATDSARKAMDGESFDISELEAVFSRSGFTDGYLFHHTGREMFGTRQKEDVTSTAKILPKLHELYRHEYKRDQISFEFIAKNSVECLLKAYDTKGNCVSVTGEIPQQAKTRGTDISQLEKHLSKLGDTIYSLGKISCDIDDMLYISPSGLNEMRRSVCEKLDAAREEFYSARVESEDKDLLDFPTLRKANEKKIRIEICNLTQLDNIDINDLEYVICPLSLAGQVYNAGFDTDKFLLKMPRFTFDESKQIRQLSEAGKLGFKGIVATNIAHIKSAQDLNFEVHADFGFNITNSVALNMLNQLGVKDCVASFELKAAQISMLKKSIPVGIFAYGRLPLMLTANCPVAQAVGCKSCTKTLYDRTGREMPVKCSKAEGYVEILNAEVMYLADKLDDFNDIAFMTLCFSEENAQQVQRVVEAYRTGYGAKPAKLTRGLYYRGII